MNVSPSDGHINISTLNDWKEDTPFLKVILAIHSLFYDQNPLCPYSFAMANEYKYNRSEFDRKAKEWTKIYVSG